MDVNVFFGAYKCTCMCMHECMWRPFLKSAHLCLPPPGIGEDTDDPDLGPHSLLSATLLTELVASKRGFKNLRLSFFISLFFFPGMQMTAMYLQCVFQDRDDKGACYR